MIFVQAPPNNHSICFIDISAHLFFHLIETNRSTTSDKHFGNECQLHPLRFTHKSLVYQSLYQSSIEHVLLSSLRYSAWTKFPDQASHNKFCPKAPTITSQRYSAAIALDFRENPGGVGTPRPNPRKNKIDQHIGESTQQEEWFYNPIRFTR